MSALARFQPAPHRSQTWQVAKPAARGRGGIVVAQAADAAQAGVAVLEAGGNAVDAAVATAFALAAVEPWNSGLGGIGFAVVHPAGAASAEMVDFGPVAPAATDPAQYPLTGLASGDAFGWPQVAGDANLLGPLSFVIPSAVEGYRALHARWGRLPLADVLHPAIALARRGLPQDWFATLMITAQAAQLRRFAESARIYLPDGLPRVPPQRGKVLHVRLGALPDTLERLQHAGLRDFYEGDIAAAIASDVAAAGGVLSAADLRGCRARIAAAGTARWRGRTVQFADGPTAGPMLARLLAALPEPVGAAPDAAWFAGLARSMLAGYAARLAGGPDGCTTHLSVCDADGGMVALTTTLLSSMGSKLVLPATGILMNNGMLWFDPRPGRANAIAPGARPLCNMCPVILCDDTGPMLAAGASGGRRIVGAVLQLLAYIADFGMDPQAAALHPRIDVSGTELIQADPRLGAEVLAALAELAPVEPAEHVVTPINYACPNAILLREDGIRVGVADAMSPWSAAVAQSVG